jgi:hypothetical protein
MVMVKKPGLMVLATRVNTKMARRMALVNFHGQMALHIKVYFMIITSRAKVFTHGLTTDSTMDSGLITKCMGQVYLLGLMGVNTWASTSTIRNRVKEYSNGQMAGNMMVAGTMVNSMASAPTQQLKMRLSVENGKMARGLGGSLVIRMLKEETMTIHNDYLLILLFYFLMIKMSWLPLKSL